MGTQNEAASRVGDAIRYWAVPAGALVGILLAMGTFLHMSIEYVVSRTVEDSFRAVHGRIDEVHERIDEVERNVHERIDALERRIDKVEQRLEVVERRLEIVEHRIDDLERRFETRMDEMAETLARIEGIVIGMRDAREADEATQAPP